MHHIRIYGGAKINFEKHLKKRTEHSKKIKKCLVE